MTTQRTELVGILNITPDSFSDGGHFNTHMAIEIHVAKMITEGAKIIDIGAESTRPGATPVTPEEEWRRLDPILSTVIKEAHSSDVRISLDTRYATTAEKALELGVDWINDVSSGEDPNMLPLIAQSDAYFVMTHHLGIPASKEKTLPEDSDVIEIIKSWMDEKIEQCVKHGISQDRLIVDPGIGFGKTAKQSLEIIKNIRALKEKGTALLVGHSRKSCLALFTDEKPESRDDVTAIVSAYLAAQGVDYLRVHDVESNQQAITIAEALSW